MLNKIKTTPVDIAILDISPKNKAVLEFFFKGNGKSLFRNADVDNATAFIIDYDFPGAKDTWQKTYDETLKPFIIFSSLGIDLPSAISITKPITANKLVDAGHKLQELLQSMEIKISDLSDSDTSELPLESSIDDLLKELTDKNQTPEQSTEESTPLDNTGLPAIPVLSSAVVSSEVATETNIQLTSDDEIEALLKSVQGGDSNNDIGDDPKPKASTTEIKRELTRAEARWALLCGLHNDISIPSEQLSAGEQEKLSDKLNVFDTNDYIFSDFLVAIKQSKENAQVIEMKFPNRTMTIDYQTKSVHCNHTIYSESFSAFCLEPLNKDNFELTIISDENEITSLRKIIEGDSETTYSIESFIWTTSMLTAQGRLPKNTNILDIITLKHWPDLTRVEQIPHAIRIAAVFYKHPGNLLEVADWLHIPQRYVFSFYNAVLALEMIDIQKPEISQTPEPSFFKVSVEEESEEKKENRGLFSRLLTKLGA